LQPSCFVKIIKSKVVITSFLLFTNIQRALQKSWNIFFCWASTGRDMFGPVGDYVGNYHLHSAPNVNLYRASVASVSLIKYTRLLRLRHDENWKYFGNNVGRSNSVQNSTKKAAKTYELLRQAYGKFALSYTQITRWMKKFKEGQKGVEDDYCSGRHSTSQIDKNGSRVFDLLNLIVEWVLGY
jgi:hypothetical protein